VAGTFTDGLGNSGIFIYNIGNGSFSTVNIPYGNVFGMNDHVQLVGDGGAGGFVAVPN